MRFNNHVEGDFSSYITPQYKAKEGSFYRGSSSSGYMSLPSPPSYLQQCDFSNVSYSRFLSDMKVDVIDDYHSEEFQIPQHCESRLIKQGVIGKGGFGEVWKVVDEFDSNKVFAFKRELSSSRQPQIEHEYQAMQTVGEHPGIVRCHGIREINGQSGLLLDYIPGADLSKVVDTLVDQYRSGKVSHANFWGTIQCIVREVFSVLHHLEERRLNHQDIKPQNIRVSSKDLKVYVIDFGNLGKVGEKQQMGTVYYTSPEYFDSKQRATMSDKVDSYSIGQILYSIFARTINPEGYDLFTNGNIDVDPYDKNQWRLIYGLGMNMLEYKKQDELTGQWKTALKPLNFYQADLEFKETGIWNDILNAKYSELRSEEASDSEVIEEAGRELKKKRAELLSGFYGAGGETTVVNFINLLLHPSLDYRLNARGALEHAFLVDPICDDIAVEKTLRNVFDKMEVVQGDKE